MKQSISVLALGALLALSSPSWAEEVPDVSAMSTEDLQKEVLRLSKDLAKAKNDVRIYKEGLQCHWDAGAAVELMVMRAKAGYSKKSALQNVKPGGMKKAVVDAVYDYPLTEDKNPFEVGYVLGNKIQRECERQIQVKPAPAQ